MNYDPYTNQLGGRTGNPDLTLTSIDFNNININWHITDFITHSDHKYILFNISYILDVILPFRYKTKFGLDKHRKPLERLLADFSNDLDYCTNIHPIIFFFFKASMESSGIVLAVI